MDKDSVGPYDDEEDEPLEPEQDATADLPRPSSPFSSTRADRIRNRQNQGRSGTIRRPSPSGGTPAGRSGSGSILPDDDEDDDETFPLSGTRAKPAPPPKPARPPRPTGPRTYAHIIAGCCYLGMPFVPVAVLFSPAHRFARFHALQALALFVPLATLGYGLVLLSPTAIVPGILYGLIAVAIVVLALLTITVAISAFEGHVLRVPILERLLEKTDNLQENLTARSSSMRALLELAIGVGLSLLALVLCLLLPLSGWFKALTPQHLEALGLSNGQLPIGMIISAMLSGLIFASIGAVVLAAFLLGLRRGKFYPSWAAIAGAVATAIGAGFLIADAIQSSLASQLTQQFDGTVNSFQIPPKTPPGTLPSALQKGVVSGLQSLHALAQAQSHWALLGTLLLLVGIGVLLFLLSQLFYKK
jgi:uncharacterized membrane protein